MVQWFSHIITLAEFVHVLLYILSVLQVSCADSFVCNLSTITLGLALLHFFSRPVHRTQKFYLHLVAVD